LKIEGLEDLWAGKEVLPTKNFNVFNLQVFTKVLGRLASARQKFRARVPRISSPGIHLKIEEPGRSLGGQDGLPTKEASTSSIFKCYRGLGRLASARRKLSARVPRISSPGGHLKVEGLGSSLS
jgi:hypothetical protein